MIYVFDNCSLSNILNHYYRERFPSFWEKFDKAIREGNLVSVSECKGELQDKFSDEDIERIATNNSDFFTKPTVEELKFITQIYSEPHFRQNMEKKKLIRGGYYADPFIIAKAKVINGFVVTEETFKEHAARIPNICEYFEIGCLNLEGFMEKENWTF